MGGGEEVGAAMGEEGGGGSHHGSPLVGTTLYFLFSVYKVFDQIYTKNINMYNTDYNEYKNYVS